MSKLLVTVLALASACLMGSISALYTPSDDVIMLTAATFQSRVIQSKELWLVEFFAPWCGHCKSLAPEWAKAAKALKGVVNVAAVDMDADGSVGAPYGIKGFPTIKIFAKNKNAPTDFQGGRTAAAIVDEALAQLSRMVRDRLGGGGSGSGSGGSKSSGDSKDVVELTDSNFESLVLNSDDIWLVEFFAPWCGHCKNLVPEWAKAATELKGKVKLGALDATVHQSTAQKYGIQGFPTIKYFASGVGSKSSPQEFDGGRTASDIVTWALNKLSENAPAPEIEQLTSNKQLEEACDSKQLCLIAFMPQLLDCQSKCRKSYVALMKQLAEKYKRNQWSWLWAESNAYAQLETTFQVGGFGYPALVAVNSRKARYVRMRGSFSEAGISEFLRELNSGRGQTVPIDNNKLPVIGDTPAWDGADAALVLEEDIDLSDVSLDDDIGGMPMRKKSVDDL